MREDRTGLRLNARGNCPNLVRNSIVPTYNLEASYYY